MSGVETEDLATGKASANRAAAGGAVEIAVLTLDDRGGTGVGRDALQQRAVAGRDAHNGAASGSHESSEPEIPVRGGSRVERVPMCCRLEIAGNTSKPLPSRASLKSRGSTLFSIP